MIINTIYELRLFSVCESMFQQRNIATLKNLFSRPTRQSILFFPEKALVFTFFFPNFWMLRIVDSTFVILRLMLYYLLYAMILLVPLYGQKKHVLFVLKSSSF